MKKIFTSVCITIAALAGISAYEMSSSGIAGYTGSPGEGKCNSCHGGGNSAASGVTISTIPTFTSNEYLADSVYQVNVRVNASGFSHYGFGCEILDSLNANAGAMSDPGPGVKFMNAFNGRRNATHTTFKSGSTVTFTFKWKAPSSGKATFYVAANAVNGTGNTTGDFPLAGTTLTLYPYIIPEDPEDPDTSTISNPAAISRTHQQSVPLFVYPNPASEAATLNYQLFGNHLVTVELFTVDGRLVKTISDENQQAGEQRVPVSLTEIPAGIYIIKIKTDGASAGRRILFVR